MSSRGRLSEPTDQRQSALNEERLLEATLSSFPAALRTRYGVELVVSDGGSTDRTVEIAGELADRVVTAQSGERPNAARQRNAGAAPARGDLLIFLDADTRPADPERFLAGLERAPTQIRAGRCVAFACPVVISPDERILSDLVFHTVSNRFISLVNRFVMGTGRGPCQVVARTAFESVGGYRGDLAAGEDNELFQRLHRLGRVGFAWDLLVYESPRRYRRHGYPRVLAIWLTNAILQIVRGRPLSDHWESIR